MRWAQHAREVLWRLVVTTVGSCLRYRVTGLAAEAAFFAVLSVPPLVFALAGAIGYVSDGFTPAQVGRRPAGRHRPVLAGAHRQRREQDHRADHRRRARGRPRFDVISLGFVLALWSGSRALNVFVDTITIMHGLGGHRGIVKTRALSFVLYVLAHGHRRRLASRSSSPGPRWSGTGCRTDFDVVMAFYWPTVIVVCICFLATLYHVSVPVRTNWRFNLPGATFALVAWVLGSYLLRWVLTATAADSRSIYGPLAAPIAVLLWLYLVAIAVLIGAAVNAAFDSVFPQKATTRARLELVQRLRQRMSVRDNGVE